MPFSKHPKSDWRKALDYITKKHLKRCFSKNGARYYAVIGLMNMRILRKFHAKFFYLMTLETVTDN